MNFNYISNYTLKGMLSERYKIIDGDIGFIKNSKEICLLNNIEFIEDYKEKFSKISLCYLNKEEYSILKEKYNITSSYKLEQITSLINSAFLLLKGKNYKEIRETRNKYNKITSITTILPDINEIIDFIKWWKKERGLKKYGWQDHSGYDINFFKNYYNKEDYTSLFFFIDNKLVGYSVLEKKKVSNCYNYIIRKNNFEYRNLCLYIDFKTFELLNDDNYYINWGGSNGSLKKYKCKFPVYKIDKVYQCKIKT